MKQLKKAIPAFLLAFALLLPVACKLNPEAVVRASESTVEPTPEPMPDPNAFQGQTYSIAESRVCQSE